MPEIPRPPISQPIGLPKADPEAAAAPYKAQQKFWGEVQNVGLYLVDAGQRIKRAQDHVTMLKAQNEIEADKEEAIESFRTRSDYQNFPDDVGKLKDALVQKYQEKYGKNKNVMRVLQPYLDGQLMDVHKAVEMRRLSLMTDDNHAELNKMKDNIQRQISETDDPLQKEILRNNFMGAVAASKTNGLLTAQQEYALTNDFDLDTEKTEIIMGAKSDDIRDLVRTQTMMDDKSKFKNVRAHAPEWFANTYEAIKTKIDRINDKNKISADHLAVNTFIDTIIDQSKGQDGKIDFDHAFKIMQDKSIQTKIGMNDASGNLDIDRWEKARTALRAIRADYEETVKASEQKQYDDATKLILDHKFNDARNMIRAAGFPAQHRETLSNWIDHLIKEDKESDTKTSIAEYSRLLDVVMSAEDPQTAINEITKSTKLKTTDAKSLINEAQSRHSAEVKDSLSRADKLINDQLSPSETIAQQVERLMTMDPKQLSAHDSELVRQTTNKKAVAGEAKQMLHNWVREQNQLHSAGKRKALTSEEIWNYANMLTSIRSESLDQQVHSLQQLEMARKSQTEQKTEAPSNHPLKGKAAGRYRVNGRIVNWDGKKEL